MQLHASYRIPGGEDAVVEAEAALLRSAGHEVQQFFVTNPSEPVATLRLLAQSPWNVGSARAVARAVAARRPDVAHIHNTWFALSSAILSPLRHADIPIVMTLHNYRYACISRDFFRDGEPCVDCLARTPLPGIRHKCYRQSFLASTAAAADISVHRARRTWERAVSCFIAPTEFAADLFVRAGIPQDRLAVKPHFTSDPGPRAQPCSESDEVLFVGRLVKGKGVDLLLKAWAKTEPSRLKLIIVGDGALRPSLEELATSSVRFVGWKSAEEVRRRMLSARAMAFPATWYEPFGMVLIEALSSGLPVVGFDVAGVRSIVQPSRPELLVRPGDVEHLAGVIRTLESDVLIDDLSVEARQRFDAGFTAAENLPLLESLYQSVL